MNASAFGGGALANSVPLDGRKTTRQIVFDHINRQSFTHAVTVCFVEEGAPSTSSEAAYFAVSRAGTNPARGSGFALFEWDQPDADRMVKAYFCSMRRKFVGRRQLPAIGIWEAKKKNGDPTYLHYHCLIHLTSPKAAEFAVATQAFWAGLGERHFGVPIHSHVEKLQNQEAALKYALKHVDERYPIQSIIMVGF